MRHHRPLMRPAQNPSAFASSDPYCADGPKPVPNAEGYAGSGVDSDTLEAKLYGGLSPQEIGNMAGQPRGGGDFSGKDNPETDEPAANLAVWLLQTTKPVQFRPASS